MVISLFATLVKRLGAVCLTFVILWHVAHLHGPRRGKAIVHVSRPDVVVVVDHLLYRVDSPEQSPIVYDLEPGAHVAQVKHGEILLDEQNFTVEPDEETILHLADHQPARAFIARTLPAPLAKHIRAANLAIDTRRKRPAHAQN